MTKEQKVTLLNEKLMIANVLRYVLKTKITQVTSALTEEQIDESLDMIATYQATLAYRIEDAMAFANKLMVEFTTENIVLGITQDGMTSHVRKTLSEVTMCLITGSLYDAVQEVKLIPADKKDPKYLSNVRLTAFVNKIETYLGIPLTTVS
jgi:hypothetical protein